MREKIFRAVKNTICSLLFLSILAGCLGFFSYLFRYEEDDKATALVRGFYALDENSADIIFIGASSFYRSISPPLLYSESGLTSYHFCSPAFPFEAALTAVKEAEKTQNPALYVVDIRRFYKGLIEDDNSKKKNVNKQISHMSYVINNMPLSFNRAVCIHEFFDGKLGQNETEWQFDYLRTHNNWKTLTLDDIKSFFEERINYKEVNKTKYFGAFCARGHKAFENADYSAYNKKLTLDKNSLKLLDDFVKYVKKNNINVLFVDPPYVASEKYYAYEKYCESYLTGQGFKFFNGNDLYREIGIDFETDFYDEEHMNVLGCLKFTPYLADYIVRNYKIERPLLSQEQADKWNSVSERWINKVAKPYARTVEEMICSNQ